MAQPRQRLVIKEMVLENFKSYAGAQRIGPFHKARARCAAVDGLACAPRRWAARAAQRMREAFTERKARQAQLSCSLRPLPQSFSSVVGPNGSGKSNVIDALLFVFGKRAKQARRGPRLGRPNGLASRVPAAHARASPPAAAPQQGERAHPHEQQAPGAGVRARVGALPRNHGRPGASRTRLRSCTAAPLRLQVFQEDPEGFSVVPGSELVVGREAHSNNTSKYLLNGRTSNFTEVTDVFKAKGVDLDNNRFLILQARRPQTHNSKTPHTLATRARNALAHARIRGALTVAGAWPRPRVLRRVRLSRSA